MMHASMCHLGFLRLILEFSSGVETNAKLCKKCHGLDTGSLGRTSYLNCFSAPVLDLFTLDVRRRSHLPIDYTLHGYHCFVSMFDVVRSHNARIDRYRIGVDITVSFWLEVARAQIQTVIPGMEVFGLLGWCRVCKEIVA